MSGRVVGWAFDMPDLTPTQKLTLVALADNASDDGTCWPSQRTLANKTGLSERTVRTALKALEARGLLSRRPRLRNDGKGRTSDLYKLSVHQPATVAASEGPTGNSRQYQPEAVAAKPSVEPSKNKNQKLSSPSQAQVTVFQHWVAVFRKDPMRTKLNDARRRKIAARLQEGYTVDDLCLAITGATKDDWLMGRDPRSKGYTDLVTILRDGAQVERLASNGRKEKDAMDPEQRAKRFERRVQMMMNNTGVSREEAEDMVRYSQEAAGVASH